MKNGHYSFQKKIETDNHADKITIKNRDIYFVQFNYNIISGINNFKINKAILVYSTKRFYRYLLEKDIESSGYLEFLKKGGDDINLITADLRMLKKEKFNSLNLARWDCFDAINLYGCFDSMIDVKDLDEHINKLIQHFYKVNENLFQMKNDLIESMIKNRGK